MLVVLLEVQAVLGLSFIKIFRRYCKLRTLYIYNPYNPKEVALLDRVNDELGFLIEKIECIDFSQVREQFKIRTTPALIFIRDDLQGENLLDIDLQKGQLRVTGEVHKALEEEELSFRQVENHRIDNLITKEANAKADAITLELLSRMGV